jgi:hypothetical protein
VNLNDHLAGAGGVSVCGFGGFGNWNAGLMEHARVAAELRLPDRPLLLAFPAAQHAGATHRPAYGGPADLAGSEGESGNAAEE